MLNMYMTTSHGIDTNVLLPGLVIELEKCKF